MYQGYDCVYVIFELEMYGNVDQYVDDVIDNGVVCFLFQICFDVWFDYFYVFDGEWYGVLLLLYYCLVQWVEW